jgi:predicted dithiol-disulfide oxidoreductase (DUF899 family)
MRYQEASERLAAYRREMGALRDKMRALQKEAEPQEVENYRFASADGPVRLSDLFGNKEHLFVIHKHGQVLSRLHDVGRRVQRRAAASRKPRRLCPFIPR